MTQLIQLSKKLDDGTILVVGGENFAEFSANVLELVGQDDYLDTIDQFKYLVPANAGIPQHAPTPIESAPSYNAPPAQTAPRAQAGPAPQAAAPSCAHGPMNYNQAKPGSGKAWKGYFCSGPRDLDRNQKCPTIWQ